MRCLNGGGFTQERLRPRTGGELHVQAYLRQRFAAEERREALLAEWTADLRRRTVIVLLEP